MAYQPYPTYKTTADNNMGQNAKYTGWGTGGGSTGGITSGQSGTPTYGGSDAWNNTNKQAASPWGGTSNNTTYGTNPVRTSTSNPAPPPGTPMGQQPGTPTPGSGMAPGYGIGNDLWNPGNGGPTQAQGADPFLGYGFDWKTATPEQLAAFTQMQPWEQMKQNSYQYGMDFTENSKRYWDQADWTKINDTFNQNLATQQQASAQQIAEWQQQNWGQQFGLDSEMARGNLQLGQTQAAIDSQWKAGQLSNQATDLAQQDWYNRNMINIQGTQNAIDSAWKAGQLTNQQRELALNELTQRQNEAFRYTQLQYQSDLQREGYKNQLQQANINAFGRAQTPRSRWIRSW